MKFDKILNTTPENLVPFMGKTLKIVDLFISDTLKSAGFDLTKNQLILLKCISMGIQSQSELSVLTDRNKSSLTRLVQSMEKKGFVSKTLHPEDKRHILLALTPAGKTIYKKAMPIVEKGFSKLENGLSKKEIDYTKDILTRMRHNANEELKKIQNI